ncbi:hypothetical protein RRG08_041341 [Elysia crispata]|uniref:Fibronectin type-III domain-containing protein n=1 Tax=Elysia crispata TaxID=231223 RepID=A0AAE1BAF4_9GAST|nr:hypothetical protein RRG08_041341 [Elysia crispata]
MFVGSPLELCPLEGYADGKNNFTVALFESIQFSVCFQSPTGTSPKFLEVIPDAGNDSRISSTTLSTSEHTRTFRTFQTKVSKKAGHTSRYLVEVKAITIQPDDLGLWKMSVVDGADKDERNPIFLSFRVNAQGPPQCPLEVNVTKQTNSSITVTWLPGHDGGAPQHFIVFYSQNSSADDRKWHKHTVTFPSNSSLYLAR